MPVEDKVRYGRDSFGEIAIAENTLGGTQTPHSLQNAHHRCESVCMANYQSRGNEGQ